MYTAHRLTARMEKNLCRNYIGMFYFFFEQILEAIPYTAAVVRPFASHLTLNQHETKKKSVSLSKKHRITNHWYSLVEFWTSTCQCWPTIKDLHQLCADTRCCRDILGATRIDVEKVSKKFVLSACLYIYIYMHTAEIHFVFKSGNYGNVDNYYT